jgi:hypothetical protein
MSHACPIWAFWETRASPNLLKKKVGAPGFEPGTFGSQNRRATKLRYAPIGSKMPIG